MGYYIPGLQGYETVIQKREREKRERAAVAAERAAEAAAKAAGGVVYQSYLQKKAKQQQAANIAKTMGAGGSGKTNAFQTAAQAGAAAKESTWDEAVDALFGSSTSSGKKSTSKSSSGTGSRSPSGTTSQSESDGQVDYFREATGAAGSNGVVAQTATPTKTNKAAMWVVGIGVVGGAVMYGLQKKGKGRKR